MPPSVVVEAPRLFLITPVIEDAARFAPLLEAAMAVDEADVACVLLRVAARDEGAAKAIVKALAPIVQATEAALLVALGHRLAARVDADGVHLPASDPALAEALTALQPRKIVGVIARGRDEAMQAGEAGVDYIMFGEPDGADAPDIVRDRAAWWAEIFNVPCVAYADDPAEVATMARTGAEFVALCEGLWDEPAQISTILRDAGRSLADARVLTGAAR